MFVRAPDSPLGRILDVVPQIARSDAPVLITGESGTGKDLLAKAIHATGLRRDGAFVAVNCAAIPQELLESELFGHVEGAFTGATRDKAGQFEAAHNGSIFLDEIGDMPAHVQVKLLRVLQEKTVTRVGSTTPVALDFRVLAATNQDLQQRIAQGLFREDLYYRLSVLPIHMPALRERIMDIPPLAEHFIQRANTAYDASIAGMTSEVRTALKRYQWPGNVRELQNVVQRIAILKNSGFIEREDLDQQIISAPKPTLLGLDVPSEGIDMAETLERLEERLLARALTKASGNKARAARLLGLNRTTFVEKLKRRKIQIKTDD
ncbi:MAG: sigma-54 dependent transcriptional regulator [Myxococcota bacterium]